MQMAGWILAAVVLSAILGWSQPDSRTSLQKFCLGYAYSVFVLGVSYFGIFVFLASPEQQVTGGWNESMIAMAITHLVGCVLWGSFVLSQISCAIKISLLMKSLGRQIVAGSAPRYLLFVSVLCWILSVVVFVGVVCLFSRSVDLDGSVIGRTLALIVRIVQRSSNLDLAALLAISVTEHGRDYAKFAIIFSAAVTIWHLIGCGFVALLIRDNIRDNIVEVLSLESVDDPKTEGREAMKEADAAAQQQA